MRFQLTLLVLSLVAFPSAAQEAPGVATTATLAMDLASTPTTVAAPEITTGTLRMLRTMEAFHADVKTVHATFDQTLHDPVFNDIVESKGELWFRKPDLFRCDYEDEEQTMVLVLPEALYMYFPDLKQVDYYAFESEAEQRQQLHQLLIGFGFEAEDLMERYRIRSSEDDEGLLAELEAAQGDAAGQVLFQFMPRPAYEASSPFRVLKVTIDKASMLPEKIWYSEYSEAERTLRMTGIKTDAQLAEGLFDRKQLIPSDAVLIDKRQGM